LRCSAGDIVGDEKISGTERRRREKAVREAIANGQPIPASCLPTRAELRGAYVAEVDRWLLRLLQGRCTHSEFDDIISRENLELCDKLDDTMVKYPDPRGYALTRSYGQRAVLDWRRRERVQRCEGAEIEFDEFGHRTKGNTVDSFDTVAFHTDNDDTVTLYDLFAADALDLELSVEEQAVTGLDLASFMEAVRAVALELLSDDEQRAVELVVVRGLQVVEAAAEAGVARETMGRQRDRAVAKLRHAFDAPR